MGRGSSSNYLPILLQVDKEDKISLTPFKFNHDWLIDEDFIMLIPRNWNLYDPSSRESSMYKFTSSLKQVKNLATCLGGKENNSTSS